MAATRSPHVATVSKTYVEPVVPFRPSGVISLGRMWRPSARENNVEDDKKKKGDSSKKPSKK